jgi:GNAT superfamily N-acetyltransferase
MTGAGSLSDLPLGFAPVDPAAARSPRLRGELLDTWVQVTDAGGAVGFVAPADSAAVGRTLDRALARVEGGIDALGVIRRGDAAVGMGLLVDGGSPLRGHWRTVMRLMIRPELQGAGAGRMLLQGLHEMARGLGLEQLQLSVRAGSGVEGFYERFGYAIIGRHPGGIRVADGDDRDEILMVTRL